MLQGQPLSSLLPSYFQNKQNQIIQAPIINKMEQVSKIDTNLNNSNEITKIDKCNEDKCKKDKCKEDKCKKDKCKEDKCKSGYDLGYGWGWLGALIIWFIIFTVLFWLIYYSLKPSFVLSNDSNQVDTAKVLLSAVISALILVIIIWLIKIAINRK
jgi:uncharacterized low-complexity protein